MDNSNQLVTIKARFSDGLTVFYTGKSLRDCWHQMTAEHPSERPEDWVSVYCVHNEA